jgi:hypothetical protein
MEGRDDLTNILQEYYKLTFHASLIMFPGSTSAQGRRHIGLGFRRESCLLFIDRRNKVYVMVMFDELITDMA